MAPTRPTISIPAASFAARICDGLLFKAEHGRLVSLERIRQGNEVQLAAAAKCRTRCRHDFWPACSGGCAIVAQQCDKKTLLTVGQVPAEADVLSHVLELALRSCDDVKIAQSPHAR